MTRRRILTERLVILFAVVTYYVGGYLALNLFNESRSYYVDVSLPFERGLPFVALGVIPYSMVFATIVLGFHSIPLERHAYFVRCAKVFALNVTVAFAIFAVLPVRAMHRPEFNDTSSLLNTIVSFWFYIDKPTNLFPSLHVNAGVLCALVGWYHNRLMGALNTILAIGVAVGAVAIHQHYVADLVAGGLLAGVTFWWSVVRQLDRGGMVQSHAAGSR